MSPAAKRQVVEWWLASGAYAVLVLAVSVVPFQGGPSVRHLDKVMHLCEYLLLAWLLARALRAGGSRDGGYLGVAWVLATSYGLLIEVVQEFLPWRSAELLDVAMNALGAALGVWLGAHCPGATVEK